jgi:hypothetical protein
VQTIPPPVTNLVMTLECPPPPQELAGGVVQVRLRASLDLPSKATIKVPKSGTFTLPSATIGCPAASPAPCAVTVAISAAPPKKGTRKGRRGSTLTIGSSSLSVSPGKSVALAGRLTRKGVSLVTRSKRLKGKIAVTAKVPSGDDADGEVSVTFVPKAKPKRHHG